MSRAGLPLVLLAVGLSAAPATAQRVSDAQLGRRQAADPAAVVAGLRGGSTWLLWSVPATSEAAAVCCFRGRRDFDRGCRLDGRDHGWGTSSDWPRAGLARELVVLVELERGRPRWLRAVGAACPIDGGGRDVLAIDGVVPARSLDLLERWARDAATDDDVRESALAAISYHGDAAAAVRLRELARDRGLPEELRGQALFWLAESDAPEAAGWIRAAIDAERSSDLRDQGVFALSQLDDGVLHLVRLLRETPHADVRRQALFWLAQSEDPRALAELERILG